MEGNGLRTRKVSSTTRSALPLAASRATVSLQPFVQYAFAALAATTLLGTLYSGDSATVIDVRSRLPAAMMASGVGANSSYFADKRNLFNVYFVKQAWAWTTLCFFAFVATSHLFPPKSTAISVTSSDRTNSLWIHARRYLLATLFWFYVTQATWFFGLGPSLSHYILLATGAQCVPSDLTAGGTPATVGGSTGTGGVLGMSPALEVDMGICRSADGKSYWQGGHDVSGHTFLLVHASLLLLTTIAPTLPYLFPSIRNYFYPPLAPSPSSTATPVKISAPASISPAHRYATYFVLSLISLWWFMLLQTALNFHHWSEKATGFAFAVVGWIVSGL